MSLNPCRPASLALILFGVAAQLAASQDFHLTVGKQEVLESKILGENGF